MVEGVRAALNRHEGLGRRPQSVPAPAEFERTVTHAWLCLGRGDDERLLRALPETIGRGQWVRAKHRDDRAAGLLGQVYQIAAEVLRHIGEHHLGWLAADRGPLTCKR